MSGHRRDLVGQDRYWFVLHRGDPVNVVWRDPAIQYHRWSEQHRAWVHDNSLFLDTEGPDARSSEMRPVARDEAIAWLERSTSFEPAVADRVITVDAEMRSAGADGRPVATAESAVSVLAEILRSDGDALRVARRHLEELGRVDAGRGENPWFADDRRGVEWAVARFVHGRIDVGDDPAISLDTERVLGDAVAAVDP